MHKKLDNQREKIMNSERSYLGVQYIIVNLYCICVSACFMLAYADAVQICGKLWVTQYSTVTVQNIILCFANYRVIIRQKRAILKPILDGKMYLLDK